MKIGRYELGYWFLLIAIVISISIVANFTRNKFPYLNEWIYVALFTIFWLGSERLYINWFLHHVGQNQLKQWVNEHEFSYKVTGLLFSSLHIQGIYHGKPVQIELNHGGKSQDTVVKCLVENNVSSFTLTKRGFLSKFFKKIDEAYASSFNYEFCVKPALPGILLEPSRQNMLVKIQTSIHVINYLTVKPNEVRLSYKGLLTDDKMLEGALEVVMLIADADKQSSK